MAISHIMEGEVAHVLKPQRWISFTLHEVFELAGGKDWLDKVVPELDSNEKPDAEHKDISLNTFHLQHYANHR